jgi:hypothetical protein
LLQRGSTTEDVYGATESAMLGNCQRTDTVSLLGPRIRAMVQ